jgi:hypothetical protein
MANDGMDKPPGGCAATRRLPLCEICGDVSGMELWAVEDRDSG